VTITPDDKDWTWVLNRPCSECGFDSQTFARTKISALLRSNAADWLALLAGRDDLAVRPRPDKWSPLEYACHVRDVFRLYDYRLGLMMSEEDPDFPNWNQDSTALEERYNEQDPAVVRAELSEAAAQLAAAFEAVSGAAWDRTGNRSDGAKFTVETFGRYFIHDPIHHWHDVQTP
jgi:DinB superfamily